MLALVLLIAITGPAIAADDAPVELAKVETIIRSLGALKDAKFIRNGSTYDAKTAVKFLLNKLDRHRAEIKSAAEFIEIHASKSSSGFPYLIRFADGREIKCSEYLASQLKKLESAPRQNTVPVPAGLP